ncbi:prepilin peptidase [Parendozoicomonas sp. Alg238-R29]|uniref:prepilin peptidase n=1 Tax=Parendozoicomonas sp. Alg238-R29 TaxID=2993446 RepID=UPI00248DE651|nr:prepilin peptidase [Parendozoicomonas sp. Alg238-R29]
MTGACIIVLVITALYICYRDVQSREISNRAVLCTAAASLLTTSGFALSWSCWPLACLAGCFLFAVKAFSGGDIKLILAFLLGVHTSWWSMVVFAVAMGGGVLALVYIALRALQSDSGKLKTDGIPYGVPIALAGLFGVCLSAVDLGYI